ncbi:MAG: hypothetical protein JWN65_2727 [Solirubrobacterales bacterium]|nr:hypothetical protein [Solirubrobacterales bacterium]
MGLDTNVLLHCLPPGQIAWRGALGHPAVRLILPLRVVEELDARKYSGRRDLAERARRLLPQLEAAVGYAGEPRAPADGTTLEVFVERSPRRRPADADEEILSTCAELAQLSGRPITLVTQDTGMRLRAQAQGTEVKALPLEYQRLVRQDGIEPD